VVKLLLDYGSDVHYENDGALLLASEHGHVGIVCLVLEYGADVHTLNGRALRLSYENNHIEVADLLKQHGAVEMGAGHDGDSRNEGVQVFQCLPSYEGIGAVAKNPSGLDDFRFFEDDQAALSRFPLQKHDAASQKLCGRTLFLFSVIVVVSFRIVVAYLQQGIGII
jgi:ankyrin repeat protein